MTRFTLALQMLCLLPTPPPICVQRSSSTVLEQTARGNCDRYIRGDIQVSTGRTMAVPLPRSSPLTRPLYSPPEFVPPCRIPPYAIGVIILGRL